MAVKNAISISKAELMEQSVINCEGDQKKVFSLIILYLVVKRSQCCQNILALLLWHLQSTCFLLRKFIILSRNFMREHITVVLPYANIRVPALY